MNFTYTTGIPAAGHNPSNDQPPMQVNTNSVSGIISIDHYGFQNASGGQHQQVTFPAAVSQSTPEEEEGVLYTQLDLANHAQLFFKNAINTFQLTGVSASAQGYAWIGGVLLQWGTGSVTSAGNPIEFPTEFPNACFSVVCTQRPGTSSPGPIAVSVPTPTGFNGFGNNTYGMNYIAIGN